MSCTIPVEASQSGYATIRYIPPGLSTNERKALGTEDVRKPRPMAELAL
jgi:hypothetical protein